MQTTLDIALNIFSMFSGFLALNRLYERKTHFFPLRILIIFILSVGQAFVNRTGIMPLNSITMIALLVIMTKLLFSCSRYSFILYDTMIAICYFIADIVADLSISVAIQNVVSTALQESNLIFARYILTIIISFMLCNIIPILYKKKQRTNTVILWYETVVYALLAVIEIATTAYISHSIQNHSTGLFLIFFLIGCFALDLYVVFVFYRLAEGRKIEQEFSLIQQQSIIQLDIYQELSNKYKRSMRVIHDVKKHVNALESLIQSERATSYRDALCLELRIR